MEGFPNTSSSAQPVYRTPALRVPAEWESVIGVYLLSLGWLSWLGNGAVMFIMYSRRRSLDPQDYLTFNLAIADAGISIFGYSRGILQIFNVVRDDGFLINSLWTCTVDGFLILLFGLISINTLTIISVIRYIKGCQPHQAHRVDRRNISLALLAVWAGALFWAGAPLLGWGSYTDRKYGTCEIDWILATVSATYKSYVIGVLLYGFLVPVCVMVYCYVSIIRTVRTSHKSSQGTQISKRQHNMERHITRVSFVVCMAFLLAWSPYAVISMWSACGVQVPPLTSVLASLFAKSATFYNPFIYMGMNSRLRKDIVGLFRCFCQTQALDSDKQRLAGGQRKRPAFPSHPRANNISMAAAGKMAEVEVIPEYYSEKTLHRGSSTRAHVSLEGHTLALTDSSVLLAENRGSALDMAASSLSSISLEDNRDVLEENKGSRLDMGCTTIVPKVVEGYLLALTEATTVSTEVSDSTITLGNPSKTWLQTDIESTFGGRFHTGGSYAAHAWADHVVVLQPAADTSVVVVNTSFALGTHDCNTLTAGIYWMSQEHQQHKATELAGPGLVVGERTTSLLPPSDFACCPGKEEEAAGTGGVHGVQWNTTSTISDASGSLEVQREQCLVPADLMVVHGEDPRDDGIALGSELDMKGFLVGCTVEVATQRGCSSPLDDPAHLLGPQTRFTLFQDDPGRVLGGQGISAVSLRERIRSLDIESASAPLDPIMSASAEMAHAPGDPALSSAAERARAPWDPAVSLTAERDCAPRDPVASSEGESVSVPEDPAVISVAEKVGASEDHAAVSLVPEGASAPEAVEESSAGQRFSAPEAPTVSSAVQIVSALEPPGVSSAAHMVCLPQTPAASSAGQRISALESPGVNSKSQVVNTPEASAMSTSAQRIIAPEASAASSASHLVNAPWGSAGVLGKQTDIAPPLLDSGRVVGTESSKYVSTVGSEMREEIQRVCALDLRNPIGTVAMMSSAVEPGTLSHNVMAASLFPVTTESSAALGDTHGPVGPLRGAAVVLGSCRRSSLTRRHSFLHAPILF
ncbi:hypothetical protein NDU88_000564 [Pleurodeles waltl]|uniref:G-protein coupled receptors family 1 profile domain-containing protein n=1 Tax=Pleurodeles waltl TaxID=8319 RepID=A0AAV7MIH2_PLEWA|nr:hypothetical protein NDU88_000564 [Pleurodeles waltl]